MHFCSHGQLCNPSEHLKKLKLLASTEAFISCRIEWLFYTWWKPLWWLKAPVFHAYWWSAVVFRSGSVHVIPFFPIYLLTLFFFFTFPGFLSYLSTFFFLLFQVFLLPWTLICTMTQFTTYKFSCVLMWFPNLHWVNKMTISTKVSN